MRRYVRWADFGAEGIPVSRLSLRYDPTAGYELPSDLERAIEAVWRAEQRARDPLYDAQRLNLIAADDGGTLRVGPGRFRDHFVRNLWRSGAVSFDGFDVSQASVEVLNSRVHVLSSYVAVATADGVILGERATPDGTAGRLSFPGSGYLGTDDTDGRGLASPREIVLREVDEELAIAADVDAIRTVGVFEDEHPSGHYNPALFSIVRTDLGPEQVYTRAETATDSWEFDDYRLLDPTREHLEATLDDAISEDGADATGGDDGEPSRFTGKGVLMLALLGRFSHGEEWYREWLGRHEDAVTVDPAT